MSSEIKICRNCGNWAGNASDSGSKLCDADMWSDDPHLWFVKRDPSHECHRPEDYCKSKSGELPHERRVSD